MLLVFDLDGTLFQADTVTIPALKKVCSDMGLPCPADFRIRDGMGLPADTYYSTLFPTIAQAKLSELSEKASQEERRNIVRGLGRLYPGVPELLSRLKADGHNLVVCSNGGPGYVADVLKTTRIDLFFEQVEPYDGRRSKAERVRELVSKSPQTPAAMVGDKASDMEAARFSKIPMIAARYGFCRDDELSGSDFFVESPAEIMQAVAKLEILFSIENSIQKADNRATVVGINGVDAAGKTFFARDLARHLSARGQKTVIIHLDDFHNPKAIRYSRTDPVESYLENAFDLKRLENELLLPLSRGIPISKSIKVLNLETDAFDQVRQYAIDPSDVVILEGTLLFRPPIDGYIDHRIFLDIDFNHMVKRAVERDRGTTEEIKRVYEAKRIPVQKKYFADWKPKERSDLVIDNNDFNYPKILHPARNEATGKTGSDYWVFDLDGTLVDSFGFYIDIVNQIFGEYGVSLTSAQLATSLGQTALKFFEAHLGKERAEKAITLLKRRNDEDSQKIRAFSGVEEVLRQISSMGKKIAVWTSRDLASASLVLRLTKLDRFVDFLVSGSCTEHHKPHPEGLLKISDLFCCSPSELLVIGDHDFDIEAAKKIGATSVRANWHGHNLPKPNLAADLEFQSVPDFKSWCCAVCSTTGTKRLSVRPSSINGRGLFADQNIFEGDVILEWRDNAEIISKQEADRLPPEEQRFLSVIDGQNVLFKNLARFVNHSCNPNAEGRNGRDVAIRSIRKDEEITVDYLTENVPDLDIRCNCGSPNCRRILSTGRRL